MKRKAFFNIAASSLIVAGSMVGCNGAALNIQAGASAGKMQQMASAQAREAEKAIASRDAGKAIQIAEAAVAASPDSAEYRVLLGRAYMMSGRFDSARTAFADALSLGSTDPRAIVHLSLIHVAQGNSAHARTLLSDHAAHLPAADYGLAMAMAGDPNEAIRVLSQAIQDPAATAKERQNLAYSFALAGKWTEARQLASLDLAPLDAAKRVMGWAQYAQPGAESQRVIAMMGVAPRADDAGLPVRLALAPAAPASATPAAQSAPIQMAQADAQSPAEIMDPVEIEENDAAPAAMAQATASASAPVPQAPALSGEQLALMAEASQDVPPFQPVKKQAPAAPLSPLLRPASSSLAKAEAPKARVAAAASTTWRPVETSHGSAWVVQLGAFSTPEAAKAGWWRTVDRNSKLEQFPLVRSEVTVDGRQLHRVAIAGFANRAGAAELCSRIRGNGGSCFVRMGGAEASPSRWALAKRPARLAMR